MAPKIEPKSPEFKQDVTIQRPAPVVPKPAPERVAGEKAQGAPANKPAGWNRFAAAPGMRVGGVVGRSAVRNAEVMAGGVRDTVSGHLSRTLDEMTPPSLLELENLLRSVLS